MMKKILPVGAVAILVSGACAAASVEAVSHQSAGISGTMSIMPIPEAVLPLPSTGNKVGLDSLTPNDGHGLGYQQGAVMSGDVRIYVIWYGSWTSSSDQAVLTSLLETIDDPQKTSTHTPELWDIVTTYNDRFGAQASNSLVHGGSTTDNYSRGTSLQLGDVSNIVSDAITQARLPADPSGVYFVMGASDVSESSGSKAFCRD